MHNRRVPLIVIGVIVLACALGITGRALLTERAFVDWDAIHITDTFTLETPHGEDLFVYAQGPITLKPDAAVAGDAALVGDSVIIESAIAGDLTVLSDDLLLGESASVAGDVALMGGHVTVRGAVRGNLTLNGGTLVIGSDARISGGIRTCSAVSVTDERAGSTVQASDVIPCTAQPSPLLETLRALRAGDPLPSNLIGDPSWGVAGVLLGALISAGISALAVTLFPMQFARIEDAVRHQARSLAGAGFAAYGLALGLGIAVLVVLALVPPLGLLLALVGMVIGVALLLLLAAGWVTLALVFGDWLVGRIGRQHAPPLIAVAVGSAVLSLGFGLLALFPVGAMLGAILLLFTSTIGLGASMLTRMGTRTLRRRYFVQG